MFDLANLETTSVADAGVAMTVRHPVTSVPLTQDDGSPIVIVVAGEDSERFRRAVRENSNRRLKAQQAGRSVRITAEELESDRLELAVSCTVNWSGFFVDGNELPFSSDAARAMYRRLPWMLEQVETFIADRQNFLKASPKT